MSLSGVDVMQNNETDEYYFLEVNIQPQLSTGALLDDKQVLLGNFIKSLAD
jgi:D-alanine-D-alanine ligase-like ATP-grasp enzyme